MQLSTRNETMEDRSICSSEDLSVFSDVHGYSSNIVRKLKYATCNKSTEENKGCNMFTQNRPSVRIFNQEFINSLRRNTISQANRKIRQRSLNSSKNLLKVSAEKIELMDEKKTVTQSLSSISCKNLSSPTKEQQQKAKENEEEKLEELPSIYEPHEKTNTFKERKKLERIEIEVFMPIIDEKNNSLAYPGSKKPVIKRHYTDGTISRKSHKLKKNKYIKKRVNEDSKKETIKASQKSFIESINNSGNKADVVKLVEDTPVTKTMAPIELKPKKTTVLEKRKAVSEMQNIFKNCIFDEENVPLSNTYTKTKPSDSMPTARAFGIVFTKMPNEKEKIFLAEDLWEKHKHSNKYVIADNNIKYISEDDLVNGINSCFSENESVDLLEKVELKNRIHKNNSLQNKAKKSSSSNISGSVLIPGKASVPNNDTTNLVQKISKTKESNNSVNKKVVKNKRSEIICNQPVKTSCKGKSISKGPIENYDGLSTESWIDRCKHLLAKEEFSRKCSSDPGNLTEKF